MHAPPRSSRRGSRKVDVDDEDGPAPTTHGGKLSLRHRQTTVQKLTDLYGDSLREAGFQTLVSVSRLGTIAAKSVKNLQKSLLLTSSKHGAQHTPYLYSHTASPGHQGDALTACREAAQLLEVWDRYRINKTWQAKSAAAAAAAATAARAQDSTSMSGACVHVDAAASGAVQLPGGPQLLPALVPDQDRQPAAAGSQPISPAGMPPAGRPPVVPLQLPLPSTRSVLLDDAVQMGSPAMMLHSGRYAHRAVSFLRPETGGDGCEDSPFSAAGELQTPTGDSAAQAAVAALEGPDSAPPSRPRSSLTDRQLRLMLKLDARRVLNTADAVLQASADSPLASPLPQSPSRRLLSAGVHYSQQRLSCSRPVTPSQAQNPTGSSFASTRCSILESAEAATSCSEQDSPPVSARSATRTPPTQQPLLPPLPEEPSLHATASVTSQGAGSHDVGSSHLPPALQQQATPGGPSLAAANPPAAAATAAGLASLLPSWPDAQGSSAVGERSEHGLEALGQAIAVMDEHAVAQVGGRLVAQYTGVFPRLHSGRQRACARRLDRVLDTNTAGYTEEVAASEVATHHDAADRARTVLAHTQLVPADGQGSHALKQCMKEIQYRRPYFVSPATAPCPVLVAEPEVGWSLRAARRMVAAPLVEAGTALSTAPAGVGRQATWAPEMSTFAPRMVQSDARSLNDSLAVRERQQAVDWKRLASKDSFTQWLLQVDPGLRAGTTTLDQVLDGIRAALLPKCDLLRAMFTYYAVCGEGGHHMPWVIMPRQWTQFLLDAQVHSRLAKGVDMAILEAACTPVSLSSVGRSLGTSPRAPEPPPELNLLRFEFMEAVLRLAVQLYLPANSQLLGVPEALNQLVGQDIKPNLPVAAKHEPSFFREDRLYTQAVDTVLRAAGPLLHALYSYWCIHTGSRYLRLQQWLAMLNMGNVIGEHTRLTTLDACLAFAWSQLVVVDELQRRHRADCMDLLDCCEAMARLADMMSPPPLADAQAVVRSAVSSATARDIQLSEAAEEHPFFTLYGLADAHTGAGTLCLRRRNSAGLLAPRSRPLAAKLAALLDLFSTSWCDAWGAADVPQLIAKLSAATQAAASAS